MFSLNPIQAPRTRMEMPAHLVEMASRPAKPSKFSQEGRKRRQLELSNRIYDLRNAESIRLQKELERKKKMEAERRARVEELLARASALLDDGKHYTRHPLRFRRILSILCDEAKLKPSQILSHSRKKDLVECRIVLYWIMHRNFERTSLAQIGRLVGGRDHSTVINGLRKVASTPFLLWKAETIEQIVLKREAEIYGGS